MMSFVSKEEQQRISAAITEAERHTRGEIVAVITAESASFLSVPVVLAAAVALFVPWPLIYFTWITVQWIYAFQLAVFLLLALVLLPRPVRFRVVPRSLLHSRAHDKAVEQFLARDLNMAVGRTGVLIFVSAAEHYAEIIADAGLHDKVQQSAWQQIIDEMTVDIAADRAGDGLIKAIRRVGELLAKHVPPDATAHHRLPDHLIVLDRT
jgi:putative membrane protein